MSDRLERNLEDNIKDLYSYARQDCKEEAEKCYISISEQLFWNVDINVEGALEKGEIKMQQDYANLGCLAGEYKSKLNAIEEVMKGIDVNLQPLTADEVHINEILNRSDNNE